MDEIWPDACGAQASSPHPEPTPHPRQHHRAAWWLTGGAVAVAASMCAGIAIGAGGSPQQAAASASLVRPSVSSQSSSAGDFSIGGNTGGSIGGGYRNGQSGTGTESDATGSTDAATAAQQIGVVDIDSTLGYQDAEAAGTGMVLTRAGEVLTNNHVVDGATSRPATRAAHCSTVPIS